jgi:hypothetical protein
MKLGLILSFLFCFVFLMLMQYKGCNGCLEKERIALLEIKHYILSQQYEDRYNDLDSWVDHRDSNCCAWERVKCSNTSSGHITELSLIDLLVFGPCHKKLNVSVFGQFEELRLLGLSNTGILCWIGNQGILLLPLLFHQFEILYLTTISHISIVIFHDKFLRTV